MGAVQQSVEVNQVPVGAVQQGLEVHQVPPGAVQQSPEIQRVPVGAVQQGLEVHQILVQNLPQDESSAWNVLTGANHQMGSVSSHSIDPESHRRLTRNANNQAHNPSAAEVVEGSGGIQAPIGCVAESHKNFLKPQAPESRAANVASFLIGDDKTEVDELNDAMAVSYN